MSEQIIFGVGAVIALVVALALVGHGIRERGSPAPTSRPGPGEYREQASPEALAERRYGKGASICAVCNRPPREKVDRFGQHVCEGFGRFSCCGYQSQVSSGADAFTHFCPPTIVRERLAVDREMDRMARADDREPSA